MYEGQLHMSESEDCSEDHRRNEKIIMYGNKKAEVQTSKKLRV